MIGRLALRSLTAHPVRSAVLAAGFGVGVAVMAILLGVAEIVLEQAQSPALVGGGDVLIRLSLPVPARLVLSGTLQSDALRPRIRAAAASHTTDLYLLHGGTTTRVAARGGIPSLERALGDPRDRADRRLARHPRRHRVDARAARRRAAADRSLPRHSRRAGLGQLVGRVAVLQRPIERGALLSDVPRRAAQPRAARGPPACGCSSSAAGRWNRSRAAPS